VGSGNLLMAYTHIAHDCVVGDHVIMANAATLGGHVEVADRVIIGGLTAVYTADIQPFYQSGQMKGILGGLKGAAEYETRIGRPGDGMAGMRSQKVAHYMIIAFIVLGNVAYLYNKKRRS
jgi:hypothetical protein